MPKDEYIDDVLSVSHLASEVCIGNTEIQERDIGKLPPNCIGLPPGVEPESSQPVDGTNTSESCYSEPEPEPEEICHYACRGSAPGGPGGYWYHLMKVCPADDANAVTWTGNSYLTLAECLTDQDALNN